jgi:ISXO2-like transposase domain
VFLFISGSPPHIWSRPTRRGSRRFSFSDSAASTGTRRDDAAETSPCDDTLGENRISGIVEVDETYVAGVEEQRRGGHQRDSNKSIVIAAIEVRGRGSGRIRLAVVEDLSAASLAACVQNENF